MATLDTLRKILAGESDRITNEERRRLSVLARQENREIKVLNDKLAKAEENIRGKYESKEKETRRELESQRNSAIDDYSRRASSLMLNQLEQDYSLIQDRSDPLKDMACLDRLTPEQKEKVERIYGLMQKATNPETRQVAEELVRELPIEIQTAIKSMSCKPKEQGNVTSYIAFSRDACYVLAPIDGKQNKELTKSLETRLGDVLMPKSEEIVIASSSSIGRGGTADAEVSKIGFSSDLNTYNGFMVFTMIPKISGLSEPLTRALIEKLRELQPKDFGRMNLVHRIEETEPSAIEYFISHTKEEMYNLMDSLDNLKAEGINAISIEEAARIIGKPAGIIKKLVTIGKIKREGENILVDSLIRYSGKPHTTTVARAEGTIVDYNAESKQVKETIMKKLAEEYAGRESFGLSEYQKIMGLSSSTGAQQQLKRNVPEATKDNNGRWVVPKSGIETFLNTHYYSKGKWQSGSNAPEGSSRTARAGTMDRLKFSSQDYEMRRQEAYQRLQRYTGNIGSRELGEILGMKNPSSVADKIAHKTGEGRSFIYEKTDVEAFIKNNIPMKRGWMPNSYLEGKK